MWYKIDQQKIEICVYAKPNAKKSELLAVTNEALHIALHAKPQDGEANKELISFIAKFFKLPKTKVTILKGKASRHKQMSLPLNDRLYAFIKNSQ